MVAKANVTGRHDYAEIAKFAREAGFRGDDLVTAVAVAMAESGGRSDRNNAGLNSDGSVDWGLWQINSSAHGNWFDTDRAYDPMYNAYSAYRVYEQSPSGGNNFDPWVMYQNGEYEKHLPAARAAVEQLGTAQKKQRYGPLTAAQAKGMAEKQAFGMLQGLGDAARIRARQRLKDRTDAIAKEDDERDSDDQLVQAGGTDADSRSLERVRHAAQQVVEQADVRRMLEMESEDMRHGWADMSDLERPSSMAWGGHSNGRISTDQLYQSQYQGAHRFHEGAGAAFDAMWEAAQEDGIDLVLTDSYRDYDTQVSLKQRKPKLAATPGNSNHGWGLAIDVRTQEARQWIQENGEEFGWYWPEWARPGGSGPDEDWHFEWYGIAGWEN